MNKRSIIEAIYPLSPMQQGMLFHTLYSQGESLYFQQFNLHIKGDLNKEAFENAWQKVVERYSVLRTAFRWGNEAEPLQIALKRLKIKLEYDDWRGEPGDRQEARLEKFFLEDRKKGIDLSKPPAFRLRLIQLGDCTYRFIWSYHHILLDGWSANIVLKDMLAYYKAFCSGHELELEAPPPYARYIEWIKKQDMSGAKAFWKKHMNGFTNTRLFGIDYGSSNSHDKAKNFERQETYLSGQTTKALRLLAQNEKVTYNNMIQGAWSLLISRMSGEKDIAFGCVVSGRPVEIPFIESMVGLFINTLPMRCTVNSAESLGECLRRLNAQQMEMKQYEYNSLVQIQEWLSMPKGVQIFESVVIFENYLADLSMKEYRENLEMEVGNFIERIDYPLILLATPGTELRIRILYQPGLISNSTVRYLMEEYVALLEQIAENPAKAMEDYTVFDKRNLKIKGNCIRPANAFTQFNKEQCSKSIVERFEEQVEKYGDRIAVKSQKGTMTYDELNKKANRISNAISEKLQEVFAGSNRPLRNTVALLFEHGDAVIAGIMGTLKSSSIYVPLDPGYPEDRLTYILENSEALILITDNTNLSLARKLSVKLKDGIRIINTDNIDDSMPSGNPCIAIDHGEAAYILYTSGSTGNPKGVIQSHRNIMYFTSIYTNNLHICCFDRLSLLSSFSHTVSAIDMFGGLLNGAAVYTYDIKQGSTGKLVKWLRDEGITILHTIPSLLRSCLDELAGNERFEKLRLAVVGGEAVYKSDVERFRKHFPEDGIFVNLFGASEILISAWYFIDKNTEITRLCAPLGYQSEGVEAYLLDENGREASVYGLGEIVYKSPYLAQGYWKLEEKAREVFIKDPLTGEGIVYKSGDMARLLPDGSMEYAGRKDFQVKIRGHRVEPGEIEAVINSIEGIEKSVVVRFERNRGENSLAAYFVSKDKTSTDIETLKRALKQKLPEYMVPLYFIRLDRLPETPNGKIDRKLLPEPGTSEDKAFSYAAPRSDTEKKLAEIWCRLLQIERIGINVGFFEAGGDSLKAITLVSRIHKEFGVDISLRDVVAAQTVEKLSGIIQETLDENKKIEQILNEIEMIGK